MKKKRITNVVSFETDGDSTSTSASSSVVVSPASQIIGSVFSFSESYSTYTDTACVANIGSSNNGTTNHKKVIPSSMSISSNNGTTNHKKIVPPSMSINSDELLVTNNNVYKSAVGNDYNIHSPLPTLSTDNSIDKALPVVVTSNNIHSYLPVLSTSNDIDATLPLVVNSSSTGTPLPARTSSNSSLPTDSNLFITDLIHNDLSMSPGYDNYENHTLSDRSSTTSIRASSKWSVSDDYISHPVSSVSDDKLPITNMSNDKLDLLSDGLFQNSCDAWPSSVTNDINGYFQQSFDNR